MCKLGIHKFDAYLDWMEVGFIFIALWFRSDLRNECSYGADNVWIVISKLDNFSNVTEA